MTVSNEVRQFYHSEGLMIMVHRNNGDFTAAQFAAIKQRIEVMKEDVLNILASDAADADGEPPEQLWGYGPRP